MNKLKSIFKKDKETRSEDLPTSYNQGQSTGSTGAQGYSQAASSAGGKPGYTEGSSATGGAQSGYSQGGAQSEYSQGGAQSGYSQGQSGGQAAPTATSFPSANAPSTGQEHADNAQGVVVHTTLGDITIALFSQQTPKTCKNFATLAATGKYDNVIFHRIIPGFMIQGGDPEGTGRGGRSIYPGGKFEDEFVSDLRHTGKGIMSMANSGPGTNGSQFFITLAATPHLDGKHTVFGQVADGLDVVDKLGGVRTDSGDRPLQEVRILRCDVF